MKSVCNGNPDDYKRVHCVCYKCEEDCDNNLAGNHGHKWACKKTQKNLLTDAWQKQTEEMIQLTKISPLK